MAWTEAGVLFLVGRDGTVPRSADTGRTWQPTGDAGGQPAAFENDGDDLYVALHDGTIKRSEDQGRSWDLRTHP